MKTTVRFYKEMGGILAVFPQLKEFNGYRENNTCYSLIGEHSTANKDYWKKLPKAAPEEYKDTLEVLQSRGYELRVIN